MASIESLPNELLSYIFQTTYDMITQSSRHTKFALCSGFTEGNRQAAEFALTISRCSRRFRDIALDSSRLWNLLHNGWHIRQFEEFLRRSKAVDLSIFADSSEPDIELRELLDVVLPHQERLTLLHLDISESPQTIAELNNTLSMFPSLTFSSLEKLVITLKVLPIEITHQVSSLFSGWSLPKLKTLRSYNFLPTFQVGGSLKRFFFEHNHDVEDAAALDLTSIHTLIGLSPLLHEFSFSLRCDESHYYVYEGANNAGPFYVERHYPPVTLPHLTKLYVLIGHPDYYEFNPPPSLLQSLIMPSLQCLEITLCGSLIERWFKALSFYDATTEQFDCVSLQTMKLWIRDHEVHAQDLFDILSDLPNLRELHMKAVGEWEENGIAIEQNDLLNLQFVHSFPPLPSLRNLTLSSCGVAPRRFTTAFLRRFKELWDDGTFVFDLNSSNCCDEDLENRLSEVLGDRFYYTCDYDATPTKTDIDENINASLQRVPWS